MTVKEGCLLLGMAVLRINDAAALAAWASEKNRTAEAQGFLEHARMDISKALAANQITPGEAEQMRGCIERHNEAVKTGDGEGAQDALAELSLKVYNIAFNKVVECEKERR